MVGERLLSEHTPDVALVDFHLRGGELAYGLIARLLDQGIPVIVVSGSGMPELPVVGVAAILPKPVGEAQLLESLRPFVCTTRFGEASSEPLDRGADELLDCRRGQREP